MLKSLYTVIVKARPLISKGLAAVSRVERSYKLTQRLTKSVMQFVKPVIVKPNLVEVAVSKSPLDILRRFRHKLSENARNWRSMLDAAYLSACQRVSYAVSYLKKSWRIACATFSCGMWLFWQWVQHMLFRRPNTWVKNNFPRSHLLVRWVFITILGLLWWVSLLFCKALGIKYPSGPRFKVRRLIPVRFR